MAQDIPVSIDLSEDLLGALGRAARIAGCDPSDYLRAALRAALDHSAARLRPDDEVIRRTVHLSKDWLELQRRLRASGYVLRRAPEGGLAIHSWPLNKPIMRLDALGLSLASLVLKFRAEFPETRTPEIRPFAGGDQRDPQNHPPRGVGNLVRRHSCNSVSSLG